MSETRGVLRLTLVDGRLATLALNRDSTVVAVDEIRVSSYDLEGRPYAVVRDEGTFRRGLNGQLLQKSRGAGRAGRVRRTLAAEEGAACLEGARREAQQVAAALGTAPGLTARERETARSRLQRILAMDGAALARDAARFASIYRPIGILPPDQYLALVLQATEGCSWNACRFCSLYRDTEFRVKSLGEFHAHLAAVREYLGDAIVLRRNLFLGDANALCVAHERLLPLLEAAAGSFPVAPAGLTGARLRSWLDDAPGRVSGLYAFVDAIAGSRKSASEYAEYARLGLRRVYVGLETGDPGLLSWLDKPGSPADAVALVRTLHAAGVACGVIVLIGAGGERFAAAHAAGTAAALSDMQLGPDDFLYFSELVSTPGLEYEQQAAAEGVKPLGPGALLAQRQEIARAFRPREPVRPPRIATYDLREFVY